MRAGGDGGIRGPREACAAGFAGQGRRARPGARARGGSDVSIIAVGGRVWATGRRVARDGMAARKKRKGLVGALKSDDRTAGELGED